MEHHDNLTLYSTRVNSLSQIENEPKIHIVIEVEHATFVPIDPVLAKRFNITENIWVHQYATRSGIQLIFTKNRTAGSCYQPNQTDGNSTASFPSYQNHD